MTQAQIEESARPSRTGASQLQQIGESASSSRWRSTRGCSTRSSRPSRRRRRRPPTPRRARRTRGRTTSRTRRCPSTSGPRLRSSSPTRRTGSTNIVTITSAVASRSGSNSRRWAWTALADRADGDATDDQFQRMAGLIVQEQARTAGWRGGELDNAMKVMAAIGAAGRPGHRAGHRRPAGPRRRRGRRHRSPVRQSRWRPASTPAGLAGQAEGRRVPRRRVTPGGTQTTYDVGGYTGPAASTSRPGSCTAARSSSPRRTSAHRAARSWVERCGARRGYAAGGFVTAADVPKPYSTAPYSGAVSSRATPP
jgi:hypothetical protein